MSDIGVDEKWLAGVQYDVFDPGCVKTSTRGERAELFSLFSSFDGACQSGSFLIPRYRDKRSTRKFDVGVFTQPGSKADLTTLKWDFRSSPNSGHRLPNRPCPKSANNRHRRCGPRTLGPHGEVFLQSWGRSWN